MKISMYKLRSFGTKKENFVKLIFVPIRHNFHFLDFVKASSALCDMAAQARTTARSGLDSEQQRGVVQSLKEP